MAACNATLPVADHFPTTMTADRSDHTSLVMSADTDFLAGDDPPGEINRMNKTRVAPLVWAAAKKLVQGANFPNVWECSVSKRGESRFQYNWKAWLSEVRTLSPHAEPCRSMVGVLRAQYNLTEMLDKSEQLAKAVIELEYRRSERHRRRAQGDQEPDADDEGAETKLMTRVRSAITHKKAHVQRFIEAAMRVAEDASLPSDVPSDTSPSPPVAVFEFNDLSTGGASQLENIFWDNGILGIPSAPPTPLPAELPSDREPFDYQESTVEPMPGLCPLMADMVLGRSDPLYLAVHLCQLGQPYEAVSIFKEALGCGDLAAISSAALEMGLTPWHFMWLRLGEAILQRDRLGVKPHSTALLCELDPVFEELECERGFGDFGTDAHRALTTFVKRGNFAALATKGLLLLDGVIDPDAPLGEDDEARELRGLHLVLGAAEIDPCTVPRLLVARLTARKERLKTNVVMEAVKELRSRAFNSSVLSLHLGALLAHEHATECGYATDALGARAALQSCLAGINVPPALRLQGVRRLGILASYVAVDLKMAMSVLAKGAEAHDAFCLAHLASLHLRNGSTENAANLFRALLEQHDERELYVSAKLDMNDSSWETYRFCLLEEEEHRFLSDVGCGRCSPVHMNRDVAGSYGELMTIELHDAPLLPVSSTMPFAVS